MILDGYNEAQRSLDKLDEETTIVLLEARMYEGKLDFIKVVVAYTKSLEHKNKDQNALIGKLTMWLVEAWPKITNPFVKSAAAYAIIRSGFYHGAPVESKFIERLKTHPYEEDENGFPKTELGHRLRKVSND